MTRLLRQLGAALLFAVAFAGAHAQQASPLEIPPLAQATVPLDGVWQFHTGDSPAWSSPALDDSAWEPMEADRPWGMQKHFGYSGFAWYRRHLHFDQPTSLALLLPHIAEVYQAFWNGQLIARYGTMPPHASWPGGDQRQIVTLPAASDGVLAIRVWQPPYLSGDNGNSGGFYAVPCLGTQSAIADHKAAIDFRNYANRVVNNTIGAIPLLMGILGLFSWLQDRSRKVVFWMTVWALGIFANNMAGNPHLALPSIFAIALQQPIYGITEFAVWFLLLYLLEVDGDPRLVRLVRAGAWTEIVFQTLDAVDIEFLWTGPHVLAAQIVDFLTTLPVVLLEAIPIVLIAAAFGKRLSLARWLVAAVGASFQLLVAIRNAAGQGQRFTHWTFAQELQPLQNGLALLLVFAVIYAVLRFSAEQRAQRAAVEQEYKSAQELQRVLIPETLPPLPGYAVTSAYKPAQQVGGDFFQVIAQPDGAALIILGDVSGKGLTAAMTVSLIVGTLRTLAETTSDPAAILAGLNRRLHGRLRHGFATCIVLHLDGDGNCTLANAGHLAPFLNTTELELPPALPLGLDPSATYESVLIPLDIHARLTLYTDGLLEARKPTGELFGFDRLQQLMAASPTAESAVQTAVAFGQDDDITVLTLTRLAVGIASTTTLSAPTLAEFSTVGVYS
jgi:serine phosphatase RsbU (regulator of sigma subunit)